MSAPSYIINWEELLEVLGDKFDVEINDIELGDLEDYLYEQFGTIIDLLKQILELLRDKGVQRIHAIANHIPAVVAPYKFTTTFNEDVLITGVTYSQSAWKYQDSWDLVVDGTILFEEVGTKEIGESKQMNVFYFVPAGKEVDIVFHNDSGNSRLVWFDIEYIGLSMDSYTPPEKPKGMILVRYVTEDDSIVYSYTITDVSLGIHVIKGDKVPQGYTLIDDKMKSVKIIEENLAGVVDFLIMEEEEPPIVEPGEKPEVVVCPSEVVEVGYVEIDEGNMKDLVFTMEFAEISGPSFPDMDIIAPNGDAFGYQREYLDTSDESETTDSNACSHAYYTGYYSHPEKYVFKSPMVGRWKFYAQSKSGMVPSLVRFDVSHPYKFTYVEKVCPGFEDYELEPFPD